MKGHAFFKGMQFVFIDTLLLLFKESSSQKPLNQKSCILCRNILRWCRFTFVHIMIPVGSVGPRWVQGFNFLHRNMLRIFFLQYSSQQASGQKCCDMCGVVLVQMCENHDPRGLDGVTRARGQIFRQEYIEKMNNPHFKNYLSSKAVTCEEASSGGVETVMFKSYSPRVKVGPQCELNFCIGIKK